MENLLLELNPNNVVSIELRGFPGVIRHGGYEEEVLNINDTSINFTIEKQDGLLANYGRISDTKYNIQSSKEKLKNIAKELLTFFDTKKEIKVHRDGYMFSIELIFDSGLSITKSAFISLINENLVKASLILEELLRGHMIPHFVELPSEILKHTEKQCYSIKDFLNLLSDFENKRMYLYNILKEMGYKHNDYKKFENAKYMTSTEIIIMLTKKNDKYVGEFLWELLDTVSKYDPMSGVHRFMGAVAYCIRRVICQLTHEEYKNSYEILARAGSKESTLNMCGVQFFVRANNCYYIFSSNHGKEVDDVIILTDKDSNIPLGNWFYIREVTKQDEVEYSEFYKAIDDFFNGKSNLRAIEV